MSMPSFSLALQAWSRSMEKQWGGCTSTTKRVTALIQRSALSSIASCWRHWQSFHRRRRKSQWESSQQLSRTSTSLKRSETFRTLFRTKTWLVSFWLNVSSSLCRMLSSWMWTSQGRWRKHSTWRRATKMGLCWPSQLKSALIQRWLRTLSWSTLSMILPTSTWWKLSQHFFTLASSHRRSNWQSPKAWKIS